MTFPQPPSILPPRRGKVHYRRYLGWWWWTRDGERWALSMKARGGRLNG